MAARFSILLAPLASPATLTASMSALTGGSFGRGGSMDDGWADESDVGEGEGVSQRCRIGLS